MAIKCEQQPDSAEDRWLFLGSALPNVQFTLQSEALHVESHIHHWLMLCFPISETLPGQDFFSLRHVCEDLFSRERRGNLNLLCPEAGYSLVLLSANGVHHIGIPPPLPEMGASRASVKQPDFLY